VEIQREFGGSNNGKAMEGGKSEFRRKTTSTVEIGLFVSGLDCQKDIVNPTWFSKEKR